MNVLDRWETKLHTLRSFFKKNPSYMIPWCGNSLDLVEPLTEDRLQQIEGQFEVTLPPEYQAFLKRFGNSRFGPGNHFYTIEEGLSAASKLPFPLAKPFLGICSPKYYQLAQEAKWEEEARLFEEWEAIPKENGVLKISGYGCDIDCVLVLNGSFYGKVWMCTGNAAYYGPFGVLESLHDDSREDNWEPTDTPNDYSFFEWYESWIDGWLKFIEQRGDYSQGNLNSY